MKVTFDIDLTPEEARKMMGLPDVEPLQQELMNKLRDRMLQNLEDINDPEFFFKKVFPAGIQNIENFQKIFSKIISSATSGSTKKTSQD